MVIAKIILTSLLSITELFILTKVMGKRQISQLSFFDYINGITIGSIGAEMATGGFEKLAKTSVAVAVYALVAVMISYISDKSIKCRRFLCGTSTVIVDNGEIRKKSMAKEKIDLDELLMQARIKGYFDLSHIQTVILEPNGNMSFLPKSNYRPVSPEDLKLTTDDEQVFTPLIIDGKVIAKNLNLRNKDIKWLKEQIKKQNIKKESDVLLGLYDGKKFIAYRNCE